MEPIYDAHGRAGGWFDDDLLRDLGGVARAFVESETVYSFRGGAVLGWFVDGVFRDSSRGGVGFIDGAVGLLFPVRHVTPVQPVRHVTPVRPIKHLSPLRPLFASGWGDQSFEDFLGR